MDRSQTLFFTGHRDMYRAVGSEAFSALNETVCAYIEKGYKYFIAGGALGFDTMAAECVLKLKSEGADVELILMLPCKNQDEKWSYWEQNKYKRILRAADKIIYISEEYSRECMFMRNRAMADASSACIAYCNKEKGGTAYTVKYAINQGLAVVNLALSL